MGWFENLQKKKRIKKAAEEMWSILRSGITFEVPLSFSKDDLAMQAVVELQRQHPGVELRFYQSRGLVLGLFSRADGGGMNVSDMVHDQLVRAGHVRTAEGRDLTIEHFLAQHEAFLVRQGFDPKAQEAEAQEARMKEEAISVGEAKPAVLHTPTTEEAKPTATEPAP